jgi:hypothetical protein
MKNFLAIVLICAGASFAAWDKFLVIEDGKGEAKMGVYSGRQGNTEGLWSGIDIGIRYSPLQDLELMATQSYEADYMLGARYQLIPVLALGIDIGFPTYGTVWSFTPGIQFSTDIISKLVLGSNIGVTIYTEDENKYARGLDLEAGVELDYTIGKSTIWIGFDIARGIFNSKRNGEEIEDLMDNRGLELMPSIGYIANIADNLALGTSVLLGYGDKEKGYGHQPKTTVAVDASVKF